MTPREQEEYRALRATIRERGTARIGLCVIGFGVWAAVMIAAAALSPTPVSVLLPLLFLAVVFEAVLSLHIGVERIGRYIQVFYEADDGDVKRERNGASASGVGVGPHAFGRRWEHAAMGFGRPRGAVGIDPLFTTLFALGAILNIAPALVLEPVRSELVVVAGAHLLFFVRLLYARAAAARQRPIDLERFHQLKQGGA